MRRDPANAGDRSADVAHEWALEFVRDVPALLAKSVVCPLRHRHRGLETVEARRRHADRPGVLEERRRSVLRARRADRAGVRARPAARPRAARRARDVQPGRLPPAARSVGHRRLSERVRNAGLALAEAWSMDVRRSSGIRRARHSGAARSFTSRSSAPYLTPATGRSWRTIDELEPVLRRALADRSSFHPRAWMLANMTHAICSAALLDIIRAGCGAGGRPGEPMLRGPARSVRNRLRMMARVLRNGPASTRCSVSGRCGCTWAAAMIGCRAS